MFTAAGLHRLAERGDVDLDAPVALYLPDWPQQWDDVRLHQLLGHTSGVPDFWFVPEAARLVDDPTARAGDLASVMGRQALQFEPGSRFSYSNTAYQAAARIIERQTGMAYDAFLTREFFAPLGMNSMRHCSGDADEMPGHVLRDGRLQPRAPENYEIARGDGGLCGSARDLARWSWRWLAERSRVVRRGRATPRRSGCPTVRRSCMATASRSGLSRRSARSAITAQWQATPAWSGLYPERDLIVIVLTSVGGVGADAVEQAIAATWLGVETPPAIEGEPPPAHVGRFDVGPFVLNLERAYLSALADLVGAWAERTTHADRRGELCTRRRSLERGGASRVPGRALHRHAPHISGMEWPGRRADR